MRVLVAGGGLAGLVAGLRAASSGVRVTVLEKSEHPGGSLLYSSGYIWSYRDFETFREQAPNGDPALQRLILERLPQELARLEDLGAPFLSRQTGNPLTSGARLDPEGLVATLLELLIGRGVEILTGVGLAGLLMEGGGVYGVRFATGAEEPADAVVLATGGFGANPELVRRHITGGAGGMRLRACPGGGGEGLLAALDAGARVTEGMDEFYGRNMPAPPAMLSPERWVEDSQLYGRFAVAVNSNGERYADETADWSETSLTRLTARQPGLRAWYVIDAEGLGARVRERTAAEMVEAARRSGGMVLTGDSLEELAGKLAERGLPPRDLLRTLEEYNAAAAFGRAAGLSPPRGDPAPVLENPPFLAVEVAPAITHTVGGLAVDAGCRVLSREGAPIPGLYAAGVEVGGVSADGYSSGLAQALVLGSVAAESAVKDYAVPETR